MKKRYSGCHMTIYGAIIPGAVSIANWANRVEALTLKGRHRLKVIDWHRNHNSSVSLTARHFGLDRETIRIWHQRFNKRGVLGLNDKSHRPKHLRQPTTSWNTVIKVVKLRKQYPAWSKYKIKALLEREGIQISVSTVGRILKRRNLINKKLSRKRKRAALHPKARFPRGLRISEPGDMIQIDTRHIMLPGGRKLYQFTAIDVLSKKRVLRIYTSESSRNGAHFLYECLLNFPFSIKAVQTDNGAPFLKDFDKLCREKGLAHYFIYPRSPKQNSYVEISQGADKREFYGQGNVYQNIKTMRSKIKEWEEIWNNIRPHQALNYLTPNAYLEKQKKGRIPTKNVITLQT